MLRNDDAAFQAILHIYYIYSYRMEKIVTALSGVWKFWGYHCQNSALIMTKGIRKVRLGVDTFDKRILDSCKFISDFRIQPCLQQSFPCSWQNIKWFHSVWCILLFYSTFYVSILLVSGKREGEEKHREPPPSLHYYFLFFQVGCTAMFYSTQGSVQQQETGESCIRTWLVGALLMLTHRTRFKWK